MAELRWTKAFKAVFCYIFKTSVNQPCIHVCLDKIFRAETRFCQGYGLSVRYAICREENKL